MTNPNYNNVPIMAMPTNIYELSIPGIILQRYPPDTVPTIFGEADNVFSTLGDDFLTPGGPGMILRTWRHTFLCPNNKTRFVPKKGPDQPRCLSVAQRIAAAPELPGDVRKKLLGWFFWSYFELRPTPFWLKLCGWERRFNA